MSTVVIQVGQCGNQLGLEWWKLIASDPGQSRDRCPFSSRDGKLAAVFIDSEPKVLQGAKQFIKNKVLDSSIVLAQGGRGSNWAYGYNGHWGEESNGLLHRAMEAVRRAAERTDYYGGVMLLHSLSGGTGSGLGSRLCEEIRDTFPAGHILTVSVAPHQSGESPLQNYNSLLSLASLHRSADGLLLFHNDKALTFAQTLERVPRSTESLSPVMPTVGSLTVMNTHIASCMAGLLLPVKSLTPTSLGSEPWELIRSVCPIPAAKLLHTTQAYSSVRTQWDRLATSSLQAVPQLSSTGKPYSSRAVLAVARGNNDNSFHLSNVLEKLRKGHRCVSWNPFPIDHWADTNNRLGDSPSSRLLTVCSNHSSVSSLLDHVVQRSKEMLRVNAYFHWYQRYGVEELDFELALETCSAIIQEYGC
uniref:tubulin delta chain-like n=1 Tax=Centroberyx gerrardi TaxID=166262 RepID=UPI003AADAF28